VATAAATTRGIIRVGANRRPTIAASALYWARAAAAGSSSLTLANDLVEDKNTLCMYNIIREKIFVIFCCINLTDIYERKIVLADDALLQ